MNGDAARDRTDTQCPARHVVLARAQQWCCAFEVRDVIETFRPVPVREVAGCPGYVDGIAIVRGAAVPVLHLGALLDGARRTAPKRFLSLRIREDRRVVLEVDEVLGVRRISGAEFETAPSVLAASAIARVGALGTMDGSLVALIASARLIDDGLFEQILARGAA